MMLSLSSLCPDMGSLGEIHPQALSGDNLLDRGPYELFDLYCPDLFCDCHKVTLKVFDRDKHLVATIAYGWKTATYYHQWGLDRETTPSLRQGFLDPLEPQTKAAPLLLDFLMKAIKHDENFLETIKSRYETFKKMIGAL